MLLAGLSSAFFFLFALEANAALPFIALAGIALLPLALGLFKGLLSIAALIAIAGMANSISGRLLNLGIKFQNTFLDPEKITVIQTIWAMLRDFVNIFFILILLVIAFATIFNIKNYKASDLLPKLIIAALLINFSLIITIEVIKLLWVPAAVFLKPLGEGISGSIVNALNIQNFFNPKHLVEFIKQLARGGSSFADVVSTEAIFRSIILVINAFLLSWMALIIWTRIPILIGLMIVSPIAWLGLTLPAIEKQTWSAWWQKLFCWGSIPIPLFGLIYFVVFFNQRLKAEMYQAVSDSILNEVLPNTAFTVGEVLIWLITAGTLLAGMMYIKGLSCSMYGWATAGFGGLWKGVRRGVGATVDFGYAATGAAEAVKGTKGRILEAGLFGGGGVAGRQAREERIEDRLAGWAGLEPKYKADVGTLERAGKAEKDIENKLSRVHTKGEEDKIIAELKTKVEKGNKDPETLAAINTLAKRGQLDTVLFNQTVNNFKDMPLAINGVFAKWKEGKFGGISIEQFVEIMRDKDNKLNLDARRMMYGFAASEDGKKTAEKFEYKDFETGIDILGRNTKVGRDYTKFWGDSSPVYMAKYRFDNRDDSIKSGYSEKDLEKIKTLKDAVREQMKLASVKNAGDYIFKDWVGDEKLKDETGKEVERQELFEAAFKETLMKKDRKFIAELRRKLRREGKDAQFEKLDKITKDLGIIIKEGVLIEEEES
ncbi:MAG: hypothetical protein AAB338_02500 [Patescibacteria group bacterium]